MLSLQRITHGTDFFSYHKNNVNKLAKTWKDAPTPRNLQAYSEAFTAAQKYKDDRKPKTSEKGIAKRQKKDQSREAFFAEHKQAIEAAQQATKMKSTATKVSAPDSKPAVVSTVQPKAAEPAQPAPTEEASGASNASASEEKPAEAAAEKPDEKPAAPTATPNTPADEKFSEGSQEPTKSEEKPLVKLAEPTPEPKPAELGVSESAPIHQPTDAAAEESEEQEETLEAVLDPHLPIPVPGGDKPKADGVPAATGESKNEPTDQAADATTEPKPDALSSSGPVADAGVVKAGSSENAAGSVAGMEFKPNASNANGLASDAGARETLTSAADPNEKTKLLQTSGKTGGWGIRFSLWNRKTTAVLGSNEEPRPSSICCWRRKGK